MLNNKSVNTLDLLIGVAAMESTCQKRQVVCCLYDEHGTLIACESNRCDPEGGVCSRIGVVQDKAHYDSTSNCNWTHAEINALENRLDGYIPKKAVLYGHDFFCTDCELALQAAGVTTFKVVNG